VPCHSTEWRTAKPVPLWGMREARDYFWAALFSRSRSFLNVSLTWSGGEFDGLFLGFDRFRIILHLLLDQG